MLEWREIEEILEQVWSGELDTEGAEGPFLDFKEDKGDEKDLLEILKKMAVCFANSDGGTVVVGIRPKCTGTMAFSGLRSKLDEPKIIEAIYTGTTNPIRVEAVYHIFKGSKLLEVIIPKGLYRHGHALNSGVMVERVGRRCQPVLPNSLTKLRIGSELDPFRPVLDGVFIEDLDGNTLTAVRDCLAARPAYSGFLEMSTEEYLTSMGMARIGKDGEVGVTMAGAVFAGKDSLIGEFFPQCKVILQDMADSALDRGRSFSGNAYKLVDWSQDVLSRYNVTNYVDIGLFPEFQIDSLPREVIRESILNAVIHRDYSVNSPIQLQVSEESVVFQNPGNFIGGVSPNNIRTHSPVARQQTFSDLFEKIGLVRERGEGVDLIYRFSLNSGKEPPAFTEFGNQVRLVLVNRIDNSLARLFYSLKTKRKNINLEEMIVISVLKDTRTIDVKQAADALQLSLTEARIKLDRMSGDSNGLLSKVTTKGKRYYRLSNAIYDMMGNKLGYYRDGELARYQWESRVMQVVNERESISSGECQVLLSITKDQAYQLLSSLVKKGQLEMVGKKRGATYKKKGSS